MKISGLQKTTLLDYPGHVAATLFLGGCNFRCPFCHNSDLLGAESPEAFSEDEILAFLKKRSGILQGVCITGGEPTLQPDLEDFLFKIRSLGLKIKLDTNGSRPEILKNLCRNGLIDYAAMDIKSGPSSYGTAAGQANLNLASIEASIAFLLEGSIPFEFRTTAVKGLHAERDFEEIGPWLSGAPRYYLQSYKDSESVLLPGFSSFSRDELLHFSELVAPFVEEVHLRGIDY